MTTTSSPRILRHCLMAGLCSAAEETEEYTATRDTSARENDERSKLNGARYRCPYGEPDTSATVWVNNAPRTKTVALHCERKWIEDNNV